MSLFAFIVLSATVVLLFGRELALRSYQSKKRKSGLLTSFSRLGSSHNLSFTSQELLADRILGFDGLSKKLLVLEQRHGHYEWFTIDLNEVESCRVTRMYCWGEGSEKTQKRLDGRVNRVVLVFTFKNSVQPVEIPFFSSTINERNELKILDAKARGWESFLSKLLTRSKPGRA